MCSVSCRSALIAGAFSLMLLSGCATHPCCYHPQYVAEAPAFAPDCSLAFGDCGAIPRPAVVTPTKFLAVGYGATGAYPQYTPGQQKLMAMRAAQVDAYRNLAEQVHGFRVWGNTAVSAFAAQNDSIRTYVDSFIRGARVVNTTAIADGNFETTVELDLSQQFLDCFAPQGYCGVRQQASTCASPGCSAPSATHISN